MQRHKVETTCTLRVFQSNLSRNKRKCLLSVSAGLQSINSGKNTGTAWKGLQTDGHESLQHWGVADISGNKWYWDLFYCLQTLKMDISCIKILSNVWYLSSNFFFFFCIVFTFTSFLSTVIRFSRLSIHYLYSLLPFRVMGITGTNIQQSLWKVEDTMDQWCSLHYCTVLRNQKYTFQYNVIVHLFYF